MFDLDRWREIFQSINKNKLRSVLSGFTISFAILLFTLLFGVVNGLKNTFSDSFVDDAANMISVRVSKTSKPYRGLQSGRTIQLKNKDFNHVKNTYKFICPIIRLLKIVVPQQALELYLLLLGEVQVFYQFLGCI